MYLTTGFILCVVLEIHGRHRVDERRIGRLQFTDEKVPQLPRQSPRRFGMKCQRGDEIDTVLHTSAAARSGIVRRRFRRSGT